MVIATNQIAVAQTALPLLSKNDRRFGAALVNTGTATVYLGPNNTVTATSGFPLIANAGITVSSWGALWAISASGTNTVGVLEELR